MLSNIDASSFTAPPDPDAPPGPSLLQTFLDPEVFIFWIFGILHIVLWLIAQPDDLSDIDIWISMSIMYISSIFRSPDDREI